MPARNILYYLSNQHNLIVKLMIFSISVGLIVYFLPKEGRFRYEFSEGKVWNHEDFKAPFSFAIQKSDDELLQETQMVERNSRKYFRFENQVMYEKQRDLQADLDSFLLTLNGTDPQAAGMRAKLRESILTKLPEKIGFFYDQGIIQNLVDNPSPNQLLIEQRNEVLSEKSYADFFTKEQVLDLLSVQLYGTPNWKDQEFKLFFERFITPNVFYDDTRTAVSIQQAITAIAPSRGMVAEGDLIISKGEMITPEKFRILSSLRNEYQAQLGALRVSRDWIIAGQLIIVTLLLGMLLVFLILLRKDLFEDSIKLSLLFSLVIVAVGFSSLIVNLNMVSVYVLPFCILPIIIRAFFDTRLALFAHILTILIIAFLVPNPFEFVVIQVLGGMASIFSIVNLRKRSRLFFTITILLSVYVACYGGITLFIEGNLQAIRLQQIGWLAASASLTLFSYPLIYLLEKVFGFTSDVSLLELSDTNNPLLRELALKAPGTFQHSLQVANLAEAAISKIGGNTLLVRTGALYHDIGKMGLARYFIENQNTGVNPHDELGFDESARLIISHVKQGLQLGRKYNLPDKVLDFIRTHHGTSRVKYFYRSFLKSYPNADIDEAAFRYPGPIPFSRETAVVMMADSVEATSRSLKDISSEKIDELVENIINQQIADNQFINADITFKDITAIKKIFKRMLMNIYHVRLEYPK